MKHFLALVLLGLLSLQAQSASKVTPSSSKAETSEIKLAMVIRHNYARFIDTKPSKEKTQFAQQVKSDVETFEATYPESFLLPAILKLLVEVDIYLDAQP